MTDSSIFGGYILQLTNNQNKETNKLDNLIKIVWKEFVITHIDYNFFKKSMLRGVLRMQVTRLRPTTV